MSASTFAWIVPFALFTFSAAFAVLRLNRVGSWWWAGAFAFAAGAFASSIFAAGPGALLKPLGEDALFIGAFVCIACGIGERTATPPRLRLLLCVATISLVAAAAALVTMDSVALELVAVQSGITIVALEAARTMRGRLRHLADRALFTLLLVSAAVLVLQSVALLALPDPSLTVASWNTSVWALVLQTSGATIGVLFAVAILLTIGRDIVEDLRRLSETDPLTGVLNRRGFDERSEAAIRSRRPGDPISLILLDIDHFKRINDRFGHWAGDSVICALAELVASICGTGAGVGRLGGEEFAVILPGSDLMTARETAERIRTAFANTHWPAPIGEERMTASFGVTDFADRETLEIAAERADRLLYIAKSHGRDQVCWCSSGSTILPADPDGIGHPGGLRRPGPSIVAA